MKRLQKYLVAGTAFMLVLAAANGATLSVVSSNNGTGLFTWTFTKGDESTVWRLDGTFGSIGIQSYGVQQAFTPAGWAVTNDGSDFLQWTYTNGTWYMEDTPVAFSIQSVFTNSTLYTNDLGNFFPNGALAGTICQSNHTPIAPGFDQFVITGPQPRPNFSSLTLSNSLLYLDVEEMMGRTCYVERSYNLLSNDWQSTTNFTVESVNTNLTQPAVTNRMFYRLRFTR